MTFETSKAKAQKQTDRYCWRARCSRRHPRNNRQCAAKALPGFHECRFHAAQSAEGIAAVEKADQQRKARREWRERRQEQDNALSQRIAGLLSRV